MKDEVPAPIKGVNPLHDVLIAAAMSLAVARELGQYDPNALPMGHIDGELASPVDLTLERRPRQLQIEAVWCAVERYCEPKWEVLFYDELCFQRNGIDLIVRRRADGHIIFLEAKGSSRQINGNPLHYLRSTKTKGRQLTWTWIWHSVLGMGADGYAADAFFRVLRPLLTGASSRALVVTGFGAASASPRQGDQRVFSETELSALGDDRSILAQKAAWLREIDDTSEMTLEGLYAFARTGRLDGARVPPNS
jgi:hypothetical protein